MTARCLSTLGELSAEGYSPAAQRRLAGGRRKVPSRLDFSRSDIVTIHAETADRMSISGVQDKISLKLERGRLLPTDRDGEFILKPVPSTPLPHFHDDAPANEHLTMQIAEQVFGVRTAVNALVRLADGELAYLTRRFDRRVDAQGRVEKVAQEDFCQLAERTPDNAGPSYKYGGSYESLGRLLRRFCPAYAVEVERLFRRVLGCYALSNGDAHLKNFSLQQTTDGDYLLTPAYDLMCTSLHLPNERRLALDLLDDEAPGLGTHGFETGSDFVLLGERLGMNRQRARAEVDRFRVPPEEVKSLIAGSFLTDGAKSDYLERVEDRLRALSL